MKTLSQMVLCGVLLFVAAVSPADAQQKPAASPISLDVEVVISRYDGAKRISNVPYTLAINSDKKVVQLNMGTQIAVPSTAFTPAAGAEGKPTPLTSYNYRNVGTSIEASASALEDGRFELDLNIDDTSVFSAPTQGFGGQSMPAFRTFRSRNTLLLRDGQMREYTAATDRVSGEVVKVSVTLRVVK